MYIATAFVFFFITFILFISLNEILRLVYFRWTYGVFHQFSRLATFHTFINYIIHLFIFIHSLCFGQVLVWCVCGISTSNFKIIKWLKIHSSNIIITFANQPKHHYNLCKTIYGQPMQRALRIKYPQWKEQIKQVIEVQHLATISKLVREGGI